MVKKALIGIAALLALAYLFWGGGETSGRYDAPSVTAGQVEALGDFNRALFLDKARNFKSDGKRLPQGMILKVARGLSEHEVRITVAEQWKMLPYGTRSRLAKDLWKLWAALYPDVAQFKARIIIIDKKDRKLAGSRLLKPADVWVPED